MFENTDKITTRVQESEELTDVSNTETSIATTQSASTEIPEDPTTVPTSVHVRASTFETTYKQEEIDTTTKFNEVYTTEQEEEENVTEESIVVEEVQTTEPSYISTTFSNKIRTERPFRGPFRLQKTYKKGASRYQRKNKNKLFECLAG